MNDLAVLIVGGGSGLGALLAALAGAEGAAKIGIIDINPEAAGAALQAARDRSLPTASAQCDIQVGADCHAAFERIVSALGRIDTLINSAAIYPRRPLLEISDGDWDASNGINIKGTYNMMVSAVRHMRSQETRDQVRGRIVNLTSVDAFKAHPQNAHYAATKAADVSLTRSFALAFAPDQILVNAIAPAGIATDKAKSAGFLAELAAPTPLARNAEPDEI